MSTITVNNIISKDTQLPLVQESWDRILQVRQTVMNTPLYYTPTASSATDWFKTTGMSITVTRKHPNSVMMIDATLHGSTNYFSFGVGLARDGTLINEALGDNTDTPNTRRTWMTFLGGRAEVNTAYEQHVMTGKFFDSYLADGIRDINYNLWIGGYSTSYPIAINRSVDSTGAAAQSNSYSRQNPISTITVTEILQGS